MRKKFNKRVAILLSSLLLGLLLAAACSAALDGERYWAISFSLAFLGKLIYIISITDDSKPQGGAQ